MAFILTYCTKETEPQDHCKFFVDFAEAQQEYFSLLNNPSFDKQTMCALMESDYYKEHISQLVDVSSPEFPEFEREVKEFEEMLSQKYNIVSPMVSPDP